MKNKRLIYKFGPVPVKGEKDHAVFWVTSLSKTSLGRDLYFINHSEEILAVVTAEDGGFVTCDDEVISAWTEEDKGYLYRDVCPGEAVKVAEFDDYYDLDYVLSVSITIKSQKRGIFTLSTPLEKGGVEECVLLFDSGKVGKGCSIEHESNKQN